MKRKQTSLLGESEPLGQEGGRKPPDQEKMNFYIENEKRNV